VGRIDGCKAWANTQMHLQSSNPVISLFICYQFLPEISAPTNFICSAALKLSTPMMIRRALLSGELRSALAKPMTFSAKQQQMNYLLARHHATIYSQFIGSPVNQNWEQH